MIKFVFQDACWIKFCKNSSWQLFKSVYCIFGFEGHVQVCINVKSCVKACAWIVIEQLGFGYVLQTDGFPLIIGDPKL